MPAKKTAPTTKKTAPKKPLIAVKDPAAMTDGYKKARGVLAKSTVIPRPTATVPVLEPEMMDDLLLAIHEKAEEIDAARIQLDNLIGESDALIREAVDEGERYRDIASAAGRTVPWVQMSLRRVAGVSTHPAAPIPTARIRKARRTY